jgi:hypothetical protein
MAPDGAPYAHALVDRPLLQHTALTARFKAGLTPMQHHWELYDADEAPIGRTRIVYGDGLASKAMRRSLTLVGMASGTLQRAEVLDADGQVVAHLTAHNGRKDFVTEVADADGRPIGTAQRRLHEGFRLQSTDGRALAALDYTPEQDDPVALRDPDGQPLAAMTRVPAQPVGLMSLTDELVWGIPDRTEIAFRNRVSQHRGFLGSDVISVSCPALPDEEPLRTLLVLGPVIAGISY